MTGELDGLLATLHALEDSAEVSSQIARRAAPILAAAIEKTLSAGTTPTGRAWLAREIGGRAYSHAANALKHAADGNLIRLTLDGPEAWGHFGTHKLPRRQMLPEAAGSVPAVVTDAITKAAREYLAKVSK